MINIFSRFLSAFLFAVCSFITVSVNAVLPQELDGNELPSLAPMLENVTPAVVNIATEGRVKQRQSPLFSDPFFRHFFKIPDQPVERKTSSLGSGVIVDSERGLVLTNHHVIANAIQITITMRDGRQVEAEIVGADPKTDIAVLKIPTENLTALKTADSNELKVGDFVVAIGNPFGLGQTVTSGIISALSRSGLGIEEYEDFIQTDASINPGNSGGALVNLRGELVGINTAIFSQSGASHGIGFAIPINLALRIAEQILETGEVKRGFLGVSIQDISPSLAEAFGLDKKNGALINKVLKDSPADKAGLQPGDVVISIDGKKVRNANDVRNRIGLLPVGEKIQFKLLRDGKEFELVVLVEESTEENNKTAITNQLLQGVTVGDIGKGNPYFGKVEGVMILQITRNSKAWKSGLRAKDVITSVNKEPIKNLDEFLSAVDKKEKALLFRVIRGNAASFIVVK
jgi:Do/DeqQ family serine protease|tara:strand:- start:857 stop:2233 length:1377 start_codon:yes stop_codon:yes gene_type:complete